MTSQLEHWFKLADEDKDGSIGGAEAVRFFLKSGLSQDTLGQIWELASGGGASLNQYQFQTAMRLVSLAQVSQGRLPPDQARVVSLGGGPQLPPPRLAGLSEGAPYVPQSTGVPYAPQQTGMGYAPQATGQGYVPQMTGASGYAPQMTGSAGYPTQMTGQGYAPQRTGPVGYAPQPTGAAGYAPQPTGGAGYAPQVTGAGGYMPQTTGVGFTPQITGAAAGVGASYAPQATGAGYAPQPTGASYAPQATGAGMPANTGAAAVAPGPSAFPATTPADINKYAAMFDALDKDRDGIVQGGECFGAFMAWGLDKGVLKSIWDVVAGNAGALKRDQFIQCVYLMDCAKKGIAVPSKLPPGPFPPTAAPIAALAAAGVAIAGVKPEPAPGAAPAEQWSLASQFGRQGMTKVVTESYSGNVKMPDMPGKVAWDASKATKAPAAPSAVPLLDDAISSMLQPSDKARVETATKEALEKEAALHGVEEEAAAAKQRAEVYQQALSELTVFKSRMDVALLQAQEHQARLVAEAEDYERRYHNAYRNSQSQNDSAGAVREHLQALLARKQEAANKLELITQELSMIQNMNPDEVRALEAEVSLLVAQLTQAEARKAAMELQLEGSKKQKDLLRTRIGDLDLAAAAAEASLSQTRADVAATSERLQGALDKLPDTDEIGQLLLRAAAAYRSLYSAAQAHGLDVPYEALLNNVGGLVWVEELLAGTVDWMEGDEASEQGYSVVNALPDLEGIPPGLLRPPPAGPPAPMRRIAQPALAQPAVPAPASNGGSADLAAAAAAAAESEPAGTTTMADRGTAAMPAAATAAAGIAAVAAAGGAIGVSTSMSDDAGFEDSAFGEPAVFDTAAHAEPAAAPASPFAAESGAPAEPPAPAAAPVVKAPQFMPRATTDSSLDDAFTSDAFAGTSHQYHGGAAAYGADSSEVTAAHTASFEDDAFSPTSDAAFTAAAAASGFDDNAF